MQHAYLFTTYSNTKNLSEAIAKLRSPGAEFLIHPSDEVDIANNDILQQLMQQPDISFIEDRVFVKWGGFSHFEAIIKLMRKAIDDTDADYMHLLSDSCYPVKSSQQINEFFEQNKGKEFLEYETLPNKIWPYGGLNRIEYYHLHDIINVKKNNFYWEFNRYFVRLQMRLGLKRRSKLKWKQYYGGSTWWSLSREAVAYCLEIMETKEFMQTFKNTFCAEEIIVQTILMNSRFRDNIINDNKRYILWETRNGNLPANLDASDYDNIMKSGALFARKFVLPYSEELKKMIDAKVVSE